MVNVTEKRCAMCKKVKTRDYFFVNKKGYLLAYCKPCFSERMKQDERRRAALRPKKVRENAQEGPCSFPGCSNDMKSKGYCVSHFVQLKAGKELTPLRVHRSAVIEGTDDRRICTTCDKVKRTDLFYTRKNGKKQSQCAECMTMNSRFRFLLRMDRLGEAAGMIESMPERMKKKNVKDLSNAIKTRGFERSNDNQA